MRICIPLPLPVSSNAAQDSTPLAVHFGLAECFAILDSDSGEIVGECKVTDYCKGPCHCPLPNFAEQRIDAVAGQAMGFRLMQMSRRAGLSLLTVKGNTLGDLRREIRKPALDSSKPAARCLSSTRAGLPGKKA